MHHNSQQSRQSRRNSSGSCSGVDLNSVSSSNKHNLRVNYDSLETSSDDNFSVSSACYSIVSAGKLPPNENKHRNKKTKQSLRKHKPKEYLPSLSEQQMRFKPTSDESKSGVSFFFPIPKKSNYSLYAIIFLCMVAIIHLSLEKSPKIIIQYPHSANGQFLNIPDTHSNPEKHYDNIRGNLKRLDDKNNLQDDQTGNTMIDTMMSNIFLNPKSDTTIDGGYSEGLTAEKQGNDAEAIQTIANFDLVDLSNFKETSEEWESSDVPIFLHIPKAGGSTIKDMLGMCHRFVMADEMGIKDGHENETEIAVVYPGGGPSGQDRSPFVNVDTTTVEGILRASEMGFADSGLADAVITPLLHEANALFTPTAKGRLFTVFRHPVERAISMFYYLQIADWEPTYDPSLQSWTPEEYAKSNRIENNWLTRTLSNRMEGDLLDEDFNLAIEVLRRKFFVGLVSNIEETMERFERFFRWTYHVNPPNQEICRVSLVTTGSNSNKSVRKDKPEVGDPVWELFAMQNQYDLDLYAYIETLFVDQEKYIETIPVDFRNIDATCCKCGPPTLPPEGFECPKAILF